MSKIELQYFGYGDSQCQEILDGVPLRDGEYVRVTWPNGTAETIEVKVIVIDRGTDFQEWVAYAAIKWNGAPGLVPLMGLDVERVNTKEAK